MLFRSITTVTIEAAPLISLYDEERIKSVDSVLFTGIEARGLLQSSDDKERSATKDDREIT